MNRRPSLPFESLLAPMRASGLLEDASGDLQTPVALLSHDSRAVGAETCFFALVGGQVDGHLFLDKAVQHGATAAVCERPPEELPPGLRAIARVTDARAALAEAAAVFFGRPSQALRLIGITGTNGKTTVSHLLHSALTSLGVKAGLIGTINVLIGDEALSTTHTTPDAIVVNELLAEMVHRDCAACAMEVSSHAIHQERVRGQQFAAAVFTNLTHEHLDYHRTFGAYARTKARLFAELDTHAMAVVNRDDPACEVMIEDCRARLVTFGSEGGDAPDWSARDVTYEIERNAIDGLQMRIDGSSHRFRLAGAFNASNLTAAYATLRAFGYHKTEALQALCEAPPVPGRLEPVRPDEAGVQGEGPIAIIDYAHTPDALRNVLMTVREMVPAGGILRVVFGAGGDRDRAKRPVMGQISEELADHVTLTNDNPRSEDAAMILAEIAAGMTTPPAAMVPDRGAAIHGAVLDAGPNDVIVVAGKGHETYQIVGDERRHFDDREAVKAALRKRGASAGPPSP